MPTPFMHLEYAERLRQLSTSADWPDSNGVGAALRANWHYFVFGSIAPDYQVLCDIPREVTHFYPLPAPDDCDPVSKMLQAYPELAATAELPPDRAAFIAGYAIHLMLDIVWYRDVLLPYFVERNDLGGTHERMFLHNMTLMVLDKEAVRVLPDGVADVLRASKVPNLLPFANDQDLEVWQDAIADQLEPQGVIQTTAIYAERMGIPEHDLAAWLADSAWLERELLAKVPVQRIRSRLLEALRAGVPVIRTYLTRPS